MTIRKMTLEEGRKGASLFTVAARKIMGESLLTTTLYGSAVRGEFNEETSDVNMIFIASRLGLSVYEELASPVQNAKEDFRLAPLFVEKDELLRFALHYPVRYLDILSYYEVIFGDDLLARYRPDNSIIKEKAFHELIDIKLEMRRSLLNGLPNAFMLARSQRTFLPKILCIVRVLTETSGLHERAAIGAILPALQDMRKMLLSDDLETLKTLYIRLFTAIDRLLDILK